MGKFELFIGYLGNGATICNKAILENNDYKQIAHISRCGNITYYVKPETIPPEAAEKIEQLSNEHREKETQQLKLNLKSSYHYCRILDEISNYTAFTVWKNFFDKLKKCKKQESKDALIIKTYLENF